MTTRDIQKIVNNTLYPSDNPFQTDKDGCDRQISEFENMKGLKLNIIKKLGKVGKKNQTVMGFLGKKIIYILVFEILIKSE